MVAFNKVVLKYYIFFSFLKYFLVYLRVIFLEKYPFFVGLSQSLLSMLNPSLLRSKTPLSRSVLDMTLN